MTEYELIPACTRASMEDYVHLFEKTYGNNKKLTSHYLQWLYQENPHGHVIGYDAYLGNKLAAHYVTIPRRYKVAGGEMKLLLSLNTATDPKHQRRGLFKKLARASYELGSKQGYQFVIGVANAQSINAFKKSLEFKILGNIRLILGRRPKQFENDAPHIINDLEWLKWRLSNPSSEYFLTKVGTCDVIINTRRGHLSFSIARTSIELANNMPLLPRKTTRGIFTMTPTFPTKGLNLFIPEQLMPSPWYVILRTLGHNDAKLMNGLQFDGLSMDTF
jgi:hypothetical protein